MRCEQAVAVTTDVLQRIEGELKIKMKTSESATAQPVRILEMTLSSTTITDIPTKPTTEAGTTQYGSSEWDKCSPLQRWTFSVANKMLNVGEKRPLQFNDLMLIPKVDESTRILQRLKVNYAHSKAFYFVPRLMVALLKTSGYHVLIVCVGTMTESSIKISLPVVLIYLLQSLQKGDDTNRSYMFAAILGKCVWFNVIYYLLYIHIILNDFHNMIYFISVIQVVLVYCKQ